jgi:hypothetical protein
MENVRTLNHKLETVAWAAFFILVRELPRGSRA